MTLTFTVRGMPAPQGSKKFMGMRGGKGIMVESSQKLKPWRLAVCYAAREAIMATRKASEEGTVSWYPVSGPLSVTMVFTLPRPKSCPKSRLWPDKKPDLSKLVRSTEDALIDAGIIDDDARIVHLDPWKVFPIPWGFPRSTDQEKHIFDGLLRMFELDSPGAVIEIRQL